MMDGGNYSILSEFN
jgi:hypothetical protein